jgi:4-carboxymuconolactone decarboxylase
MGASRQRPRNGVARPARLVRGRLALDGLLGFASAMTRGSRAAAVRSLAGARRGACPRRAAEETALMLVLHAGFPAALEALALLNESWPGRARAAPEGDRAAWRRRGERLCRRIYGGAFDRLVDNVERLHPAMRAWMIEEGYGRVLSRPGLPAAWRELVAVAVLAASGWERQLVSHLLGALRMGAPTEEVRRAIAIGARGADAKRRRSIGRAWSRARRVAV